MGLQCLYRPVLLATIRMRRDFDVVRGFGVVRFRLPTPQLPAAVLTAIAALASTLEGMVFRPGVWDGRGLQIFWGLGISSTGMYQSTTNRLRSEASEL